MFLKNLSNEKYLVYLVILDWPSAANLGVKQFPGSTQEGMTMSWSEIPCTIWNLFCGLGFLNFIYCILGRNANSSLEGTKTSCQMFAELYQVSWHWHPDAFCHVFAWNISSLLDSVTPNLEKYYNACCLQFLIPWICVFMSFLQSASSVKSINFAACSILSLVLWSCLPRMFHSLLVGVFNWCVEGHGFRCP